MADTESENHSSRGNLSDKCRCLCANIGVAQVNVCDESAYFDAACLSTHEKGCCQPVISKVGGKDCFKACVFCFAGNRPDIAGMPSSRGMDCKSKPLAHRFSSWWGSSQSTAYHRRRHVHRSFQPGDKSCISELRSINENPTRTEPEPTTWKASMTLLNLSRTVV